MKVSTTGFALALILATTATAGPLAPKKASDLIALAGFGGPPFSVADVNVRVDGDGTGGTFTIPPGEVFVITPHPSDPVAPAAVPKTSHGSSTLRALYGGVPLEGVVARCCRPHALLAAARVTVAGRE
jgi:hypothetical protein